MRTRTAVTIVLILLRAPAAPGADQPSDISAEKLARRVGQVFAGYEDFWVWVRQTEFEPDGTFRGEVLGRAYFKRDKKFRLNFGQPPRLIHGTDGGEYWIYRKGDKFVRVGDPDDDRGMIHPILPVFAAGGRMAKALDRYFDVDALVRTEFVARDRKNKEETVEGYRLVITPKREDDEPAEGQPADPEVEKLRPDLTHEQVWSFWVEKETFEPKRIQVVWRGEGRSVYEFDRFHSNTGLGDRVFRCPPGLKKLPLKQETE